MLTLLVVLVLTVLSGTMKFQLPSVTAGIVTFLLFSTFGAHLAFMFSSRQSGETSVGLLMASIIGHLVVNIVFILLLLYFNSESAFTITFIFFGVFIVFMIYEIVMISLFINIKSSE